MSDNNSFHSNLLSPINNDLNCSSNFKDIDNETLESKAKKTAKEYFETHSILMRSQLNEFLQLLGWSEIWSTEEEKETIWNLFIKNAPDKADANYENVANGIDELFNGTVHDFSIADDDFENDPNLNISALTEKLSRAGSFRVTKQKNNIDNYWQSVKSNRDLLKYIKMWNELIWSINLKKVNIEDTYTLIKSRFKFIMIDKEELENYIKAITEKEDMDNNISINPQWLTIVNNFLRLQFKQHADKSKENSGNTTNNIQLPQTPEIIIERLMWYDNITWDYINTWNAMEGQNEDGFKDFIMSCFKDFVQAKGMWYSSWKEFMNVSCFNFSGFPLYEDHKRNLSEHLKSSQILYPSREQIGFIKLQKQYSALQKQFNEWLMKYNKWYKKQKSVTNFSDFNKTSTNNQNSVNLINDEIDLGNLGRRTSWSMPKSNDINCFTENNNNNITNINLNITKNDTQNDLVKCLTTAGSGSNLNINIVMQNKNISNDWLETRKRRKTEYIKAGKKMVKISNSNDDIYNSKYDDWSNSRFDLFSIQDNSDKFLWDTTGWNEPTYFDNNNNNSNNYNTSNNKPKNATNINDQINQMLDSDFSPINFEGWSLNANMNTFMGDNTEKILNPVDSNINHYEFTDTFTTNLIDNTINPSLSPVNTNVNPSSTSANTGPNDQTHHSNPFCEIKKLNYYNHNNSIKEEEEEDNMKNDSLRQSQITMNKKNTNDKIISLETFNGNNSNTVHNNTLICSSATRLNNTTTMTIIEDLTVLWQERENWVNPNNNKTNGIIAYYDWIKWSNNKTISNILTENKDDLIANEILTEYISYYIENNKKKKGIWVITANNIYIWQQNKFECLHQFKLSWLDNLGISNHNCNIVLFQFSNNTNMIIETLRRMELLYYWVDLYKYKKYPSWRIKYTNNFTVRQSDDKLPNWVLSKHKDFWATPNFENCQKMGYLYKYKENFFSASFAEKLVVLCSLGLLFFDDPNKPPKKIIPIIGTNIKTIICQAHERWFCFKLKTANNETFIFGAKEKEEIVDWMKEFKQFRVFYDIKMKGIDVENKMRPVIRNASTIRQRPSSTVSYVVNLVMNNTKD